MSTKFNVLKEATPTNNLMSCKKVNIQLSSESLSNSKGLRRFHLAASGLEGSVVSAGDRFTALI